MNKNLMMTAALLAACLGMNAQQKVGTWSVQPKVGLNVAKLTAVDNASFKVGAVAGAEVEYQATKWLGVTAGVEYSQQGHKIDEVNWAYVNTKIYTAPTLTDGTDVTQGHYLKKDGMKLELEYLNVPILANIYVVKGLAVKAGMQFGFLTKAKYPSEVFGMESGTMSIKDYVHKTDVSIPMGVSYEYKGFVVDARYHLGVTRVKSKGLAKIQQTDDRYIIYEADGFKNDNIRNSYFSFTIGYKFGL